MWGIHDMDLWLLRAFGGFFFKKNGKRGIILDPAVGFQRWVDDYLGRRNHSGQGSLFRTIVSGLCAQINDWRLGHGSLVFFLGRY